MPKRKLTQEPSARPPLRKSARLLERETHREVLSKEKVQLEESVPKASVPVIESPEKPVNDDGAGKIDQKERDDPISFWAAHQTWPENFAEHNSMNSLKRQRPLDYDNDERAPSYSRRRKYGEVPEQYTAAYENYILDKGLDMRITRGAQFVSKNCKELCVNLKNITYEAIKPTIFPKTAIGQVLELYRNRNEAIINRDITSMIIPPITSLYFDGVSNLEHVVDEVNTDWYAQCILAGPQIRPDLAIGLSSSAFTKEEMNQLKRYTSIDNWTQFTTHMFFPFLVCEVKCGSQGLDKADRQNMHSCSVAVRALIRIQQEADKYRPVKEIEKKADSLNGQILVFSISHDQDDARVYGHYAIVQDEKWSYYRYRIQRFDLAEEDSLLAIHNFVRNIFTSYLPEHVQRLKDALAVLPELNKPPESSGMPYASSGIAQSDGISQQASRVLDADGFVVPPLPNTWRYSGSMTTGQMGQLFGQIEKLMQQLQDEREVHRKEMEEIMKREERLREETMKREERLREENEGLGQQLGKLMETLTQSLSAPSK